MYLYVELVIPVFVSTKEARDKRYLIGVLDIDAKVKNFFSQSDVESLQECINIWAESIHSSNWDTMFAPLACESDFVENSGQEGKIDKVASVSGSIIVLDSSQRRRLFDNTSGPLCESGISSKATANFTNIDSSRSLLDKQQDTT